MTCTLKDKTVLVTGANSGIGLSAATSIAKEGADLLIVCRTAEKASRTAETIRAAAAGARVEPLACDFSSQTQIRALAAEFQSRRDRLHVLLNNAGALIGERRVTEDGLETTFAVNHLGYFLLTNLLLDTMRASAPARIISVASGAHFDAKDGLDFADLQAERKPYKQFRVYAESKLANVYFTYELARRLAGSGITVNCIHPGVVRTGFGTTGNALFQLGVKVARPFMLPPEKGADTAVYLATAPEVENVTGKYFYKRLPRRTSKVSYDESACRRLWDVSEKLTELNRA